MGLRSASKITGRARHAGSPGAVLCAATGPSRRTHPHASNPHPARANLQHAFRWFGGPRVHRPGRRIALRLQPQPRRTARGLPSGQSRRLPNLDLRHPREQPSEGRRPTRSFVFRAQLVSRWAMVGLSRLPRPGRSGTRLVRRLRVSPGWDRIPNAHRGSVHVVRSHLRHGKPSRRRFQCARVDARWPHPRPLAHPGLPSPLGISSAAA